MRKRTIYYLPLLCLLVLAGCKKEDVMPLPGEGKGDELVLNPTIDGLSLTQSDVQSRAVVDMKVADFDTYGFDIAGYYTEGDFNSKSAEAYPNVFDKDEPGQAPVPRVTKNPANHPTAPGKYSLKTVKWALTDNGRLSFFAWGQRGVRPGEAGSTDQTFGIKDYVKNIDNKGYPWIEVKYPGNQAIAVDIVGARVMDQRNDAVISAVDLEFHHLLAKVTVKAKNSMGGKIVFSKANLVGGSKAINMDARYTFGNAADKLGTWSNYSRPEGFTHTLDGKTETINSGAEVKMGDAIFIPQSVVAGKFYCDVAYQVEIAPGVMSQTITRSLPAPALDLQENTNHVLTLDFTDNDQIVFNTSVAPWTEVTANTLPYVPGPCDPDVMIELDGSDAPYYDIATGKQYWLDRSGWNRHAELAGFGTNGFGYDANTKSYYTNGNATTSVIMPEFPDGLDAMTADIVVFSTNTGSFSQSLIALSSVNLDIPVAGRQFFAHHGHAGNNTIYFDVRATSTAGYDRIQYPYPDGKVNDLAMWSYTATNPGWGPNTALKYSMQIHRNGKLLDQKDGKSLTTKLHGLKYNQMMKEYNGNLNYVKIMRKVRTNGEVLRDYVKVYRKFRISDTSVDMPPVTNGLMLCFDARDVQNTSLVAGKTVWPDRSPNKNHAVFKDASKIVRLSDAKEAHYFLMGKESYAEMLYDLPAATNSFTIELVMRVVGGGAGSPISFRSNMSGNSDGVRHSFHMPYGNGNVYIDMPLITSDRFQFPYDNLMAYIGKPAYWSIVRDQDVAKIIGLYRNNKVIKDYPTKTLTLGALQRGVIGATREANSTLGSKDQQFEIYAIRVYDRPLSEAERQQNYEFDKAIYGIE